MAIRGRAGQDPCANGACGSGRDKRVLDCASEGRCGAGAAHLGYLALPLLALGLIGCVPCSWPITQIEVTLASVSLRVGETTQGMVQVAEQGATPDSPLPHGATEVQALVIATPKGLVAVPAEPLRVDTLGRAQFEITGVAPGRAWIQAVGERRSRPVRVDVIAKGGDGH